MATKSLRNIWVVVLMSLAQVLMAQNHYSFQRDINYRGGSESDEYMSAMCKLDIAHVAQSTGKPVIVWFHGGGLTGGRREIPQELLQDSIIVVGVEYRLSSKATIDEIIDDAAASTAWVIGNIGKYGGDKRKVFLSGHSAGGYLADMLALDKSRLGKYGIDADSLAGVIPFSGQCITHFEARDRQGIHPLQPTIDNLAPLYHVRENCPPFLIISGDREKELYGRYEEQAYLWRMLKLRGNRDVTLYELDGFDHGGMCRPAFPLLLQFVRDHSPQSRKNP